MLIATYPSLAYDARRPSATGRWISGCDLFTLSPVHVTPQSELLVRLHAAEDGALILLAVNLGPTSVDSNVQLRNATIETARVSAGMQLLDGGLRISLKSQDGALGVLQTRILQRS
jgi:hypothetical protein